jgi:hypothetical protein
VPRHSLMRVAALTGGLPWARHHSENPAWGVRGFLSMKRGTWGSRRFTSKSSTRRNRFKRKSTLRATAPH